MLKYFQENSFFPTSHLTNPKRFCSRVGVFRTAVSLAVCWCRERVTYQHVTSAVVRPCPAPELITLKGASRRDLSLLTVFVTASHTPSFPGALQLPSWYELPSVPDNSASPHHLVFLLIPLLVTVRVKADGLINITTLSTSRGYWMLYPWRETQESFLYIAYPCIRWRRCPGFPIRLLHHCPNEGCPQSTLELF